MITIMLAFYAKFSTWPIFNSAHADSLPQRMVQTKTTKVTVGNKDVPDAVRKLAEDNIYLV